MNEERNKFLDLIIYQVYPRSFYDSNGDGIGDLNGVTDKLDYLFELGINAIWLSPCYKSPNCDNGYDISDYRDIMDEFGTLADWERMISEAHKRGIKIIMDLVANHTSDEHFWFQEARKSRDNPYHDYYYWADKPLTDWKAAFGGSTWEYNEQTNEYYFHSFAVKQPDLNWTNPKVRKEMCAVVDYWVDKGVDGFRCDVLDFISKDFAAGKLLNGPHLHKYIRELFGREKTKHIFTVGECQSDIKNITDICGEDRHELTCVFQFDHFNTGRYDKYLPCAYKIDETRDILVKWQNFSYKHNILYTLFLENHDQPRYISRLGNDGELRYESATMYAAMFYLLKGIPFIYEGQEFGTPNPEYSDIVDFNDVETVNYYHENEGKVLKNELMERVNFGSRDNARRPMTWTSGKNFGFGQGKAWITLHSRGAEVNAERDIASEKSVLRFYKRLLKFRTANEIIRYGDFKDCTKQDGCFVYERTLNDEVVLVVCNFDKANTISTGHAATDYIPVISNYNRSERTPDGIYAPYEVAVFVKNGAAHPIFD